jgi:hypothetical protein
MRLHAEVVREDTGDSTATAECSCGAVRLELSAPPLFGMFCHCTICRRFNASDYADFLLYRREDVAGADDAPVDFSKLKPPPNIQRGVCRDCGTPILEHLDLPLLGRWSFVPRNVHKDTGALPAACAHLFYHRRLNDIDDELPKHSGYWKSELAFLAKLLLPVSSRR